MLSSLYCYNRYLIDKNVSDLKSSKQSNVVSTETTNEVNRLKHRDKTVNYIKKLFLKISKI